MYTVESKSMLARLMASENLTVEHRSQAKTAKFDLKNRRLICPLWKDMSGDLYDLLMGHEISHALNTPLEGWHDSIVYAGGEVKASKQSQKSFRHFLNVIEDARIEKLVKRLYPGLRGPMARGYKDLMARDFFGLHGRSNFNELYLIDKLNLSAKVGSLLHIRFNTKEQPFYDAMQALETWEEVVDLTKKLYAYSKAEQKTGEELFACTGEEGKKKKAEEERKKQEEERKKQEEERKRQEKEEGDQEQAQNDEEGETEGEEDEDRDSEGEGFADEDEFEPESETDKNDDSDEDSEESDDDDDSDEDSEESDDSKEETGGESEESDEAGEESDEEGAASSGGQEEGTGDSEKNEFIPEASTDENFRNHEQDLVEQKEVRSLYLTIPTPNLKDCVTPAAIVNRGLTEYYSGQRAKGQALLTAFRKKNDDYIGLLAKEFEMKKAAKSYKHLRQAESGDIDITKLASYRTEDNISKKLMIVHKGKSHGLVLLLDRSSSMEPSIIGATEQILILALFCRKVNIPFVAYSFMDNDHAANKYDFDDRVTTLKPFSQNDEEFATSEIAFREMVNSSMQPFEFNQSLMNQLQLADGLGNRRRVVSGRDRFRRGGYYTFNTANYPDHEKMGSTPLNEALVILRDMIRQFKMKHHLDIVNAVIVHDGESNMNYAFHEDGRIASAMRYERSAFIKAEQNFDTQEDRVTIQDKKEQLSFVCPHTRGGLQTALQVWIQTTTGCGLFGFYVLSDKTEDVQDGLGKMYVNELGIPLGHLSTTDAATSDRRQMHSALAEKLEDEKFLESYIKGYTRFYFIPGSTKLETESGELVNTGKSNTWTGRTLLTAFVKANKKRAVSHVLVGRFIDQIAVH